MNIIKQKIILPVLVLAVVTSSRGVPVSYEHNYAPDHDHSPKDYSFSYGVKDIHTGDVKHQWEKKDGDLVRGHYSLVEADGSVRIVDYTADSKTGFNAVVKHKGTAHHPHTNTGKATSHKSVEIAPIKGGGGGQHGYNYQQTALGLSAEGAYKGADVTQNSEDQSSSIKYVYIPQGDNIDGLEDAGDQKYPSYEVKDLDYESEGSKFQPTSTRLPIDLSVIKPKENIQQVDVSVLKPIEIDIPDIPYSKKTTSYDVPQIPYTPTQNTATKTNQDYLPGPISLPGPVSFASASKGPNGNELSESDYQKFLKDYYREEGVKESSQFSEDEYQKFLKDYYKDPKTKRGSSGSSSNTFRTNKKPASTPGLRNYSSAAKYKQSSNKPKINYQPYSPSKTTGLYNERNDLKGSGSRTHRTSLRFRGYTRKSH